MRPSENVENRKIDSFDTVNFLYIIDAASDGKLFDRQAVKCRY